MLDRIARELSEAVQVLNLRARRAELLASNIANADTPHYKARDFDFRAAMTSAMRKSELPMARTQSAHLESSAMAPSAVRVQYRVPVQPSIDGNTVEVDAEVGRIADNALRYQAAVTFINGEISHIRMALQGQ